MLYTSQTGFASAVINMYLGIVTFVYAVVWTAVNTGFAMDAGVLTFHKLLGIAYHFRVVTPSAF